jgi:hypothetical protein
MYGQWDQSTTKDNRRCRQPDLIIIFFVTDGENY